MMKEEMKRKIDAVLDTVKDPESFRSVSELNLVKKVTWSESQKKLVVHTDIGEPRSTCIVCGVVNETLRQSIMRNLKEEFDKSFPDLDVEVI
ncbi:MAG: hypothetical protein H7A26_03255 [Spirochaetales bacterium]|nr:hypothetical protein [Spirochaetales bacterium]